MVELIFYAMMLNPTGHEMITPPEKPKIEVSRKRGKGQRGRKRGGSGLR